MWVHGKYVVKILGFSGKLPSVKKSRCCSYANNVLWLILCLFFLVTLLVFTRKLLSNFCVYIKQQVIAQMLVLDAEKGMCSVLLSCIMWACLTKSIPHHCPLLLVSATSVLLQADTEPRFGFHSYKVSSYYFHNISPVPAPLDRQVFYSMSSHNKAFTPIMEYNTQHWVLHCLSPDLRFVLVCLFV